MTWHRKVNEAEQAAAAARVAIVLRQADALSARLQESVQELVGILDPPDPKEHQP